MKKWIIIGLLTVFSVGGFAQKSVLTGTLTGHDGNTKLIVSEVQRGKLVPVDTLSIDKKGRFKYEKEVKADAYFMTVALNKPQNPTVHVLMMPKEKVSVDLQYLPEAKQVKVVATKGSQNMEVYRQYNNMMIEALQDATKREALADKMSSLLTANADVLMSAFLVTYFESAFEQYSGLYRTVRDSLVGKYPDNDFVKHLDSKLRAAIVAGMEAPDIELPDRNGEARRLSDLRGKVVLIDFWASWCRPCRMENPNVVRVYQRYHDKGFEIFSVSLDNNKEAWIKAIEADGLIWPNHVSDLRGWSSAGGRLYGIQSIPATVLVDPEGKVIARNLRGAELEKKLSEIFQNK